MRKTLSHSIDTYILRKLRSKLERKGNLCDCIYRSIFGPCLFCPISIACSSSDSRSGTDFSYLLSEGEQWCSNSGCCHRRIKNCHGYFTQVPIFSDTPSTRTLWLTVLDIRASRASVGNQWISFWLEAVMYRDPFSKDEFPDQGKELV